ncbi:alpha/beta family hydrolase [Cellulomonas fimi]|uniref:Hydrolase of the alpha/beta-hydrolase fold family n=1 Tax=Cellulomonas fimi (strain ATCC 484 / DSM 20113 / JCM 1341 / CCUG 24087 / LMG 16345 / NBRC 15513 / NCIMB 8980 / NCTC 7547 / NRS-133) TaxID=590998 RepID=F4H1Q8_CELFA|nr:alpha/beta family hydrolase [Cellulomonas fimi]AEE47478.1 hydrolase of the alpha/beta-hydrolase fold family [Cellulomonas fimi ATCC 484]VEH36327.1 Alpha/beta hydrolase family [Cellulomonas fimi]
MSAGGATADGGGPAATPVAEVLGVDPAARPRDVAGVVLTPGASAGRDHRTLVALEAALAPLPVLRLDFPNQSRGSRAPERPEAAVPHLREHATAFAAELGTTTDRLVLGGRSFGGRMSSLVASEGMPLAGLVLLSYPLHPPGRPDDLRVAHLPDVTVPVLAVSGLRDPFGAPDELRTHLAGVAGPLTLAFVPGDHSPTDDVAVATVVRAWLLGDAPGDRAS